MRCEILERVQRIAVSEVAESDRGGERPVRPVKSVAQRGSAFPITQGGERCSGGEADRVRGVLEQSRHRVCVTGRAELAQTFEGEHADFFVLVAQALCDSAGMACAQVGQGPDRREAHFGARIIEQGGDRIHSVLRSDAPRGQDRCLARAHVLVVERFVQRC